MPNPLTVALTDLALRAGTAGVQYLVPKLADWILPLSEVQALVSSGEQQLKRCVVLQDGTEVCIRIDINKVPGLRDVLRRGRNQYGAEAGGPDSPTLTTVIVNAKELTEVNSAAGGTVSVINGLIGITF